MPDESAKRYVVIATSTALTAIRDQVHHIAVEQRSPQNATEWLDRIWTSIDELELLPTRFPEAEGYSHLPYIVRRIVVDNHLILFTVDHPNATVYVVGLRHGASLPRLSDLPPQPEP